MGTKAKAKTKRFKGIESAFLVILLCAAAAVCVFIFVLGNPENFHMVEDPETGEMVRGNVKDGNLLTNVYNRSLRTLF